MFSAQTDTQLWDAFRTGDRLAFEAIYDRYVQVLYNYGCKLSSDGSLVQDLIQDLFIEIWNSRDRLGPTDSIKFYLFRSLRRKIARAAQKADQHDPLDAALPDHFGLCTDPEAELMDEQSAVQRKTQLERALGQLTRRQKEAIYLRFYQGLSYEEVAEVMALEMKSTYNLVSRTLEILRAHLKRSPLTTLALLTNLLG